MSCDALAVGSQLAGYRIEGVLGAGGMGVGYRARQLTLDRVIALKVLAGAYADDAELARRVRGEALVAASLEPPNVVPVYEADGRLFIAMRLVTSRAPLHIAGERVHELGPLSLPAPGETGRRRSPSERLEPARAVVVLPEVRAG